jgi:hypothetical protein
MRQLKFSLLALASLLVACASGSSGSSTQAGAPSPSRTRSNPNVITADELSRIDVSDALQAIQRLRPQFLQTRGATSFQSPSELVVYVDGSRLGNASTLRDVPANEVKEIRYLSSTEATQRYGTGHTSGAIVVTRK